MIKYFLNTALLILLLGYSSFSAEWEFKLTDSIPWTHPSLEIKTLTYNKNKDYFYILSLDSVKPNGWGCYSLKTVNMKGHILHNTTINNEVDDINTIWFDMENNAILCNMNDRMGIGEIPVEISTGYPINQINVARKDLSQPNPYCMMTFIEKSRNKKHFVTGYKSIYVYKWKKKKDKLILKEKIDYPPNLENVHFLIPDFKAQTKYRYGLISLSAGEVYFFKKPSRYKKVLLPVIKEMPRNFTSNLAFADNKIWVYNKNVNKILGYKLVIPD